ncbi:MAG: M24 family metallopeptidase [Micromonosporaceae bacterium]|nr:M24 family metallopeptidase [Micromonosporaceae bacterium]
MTVAERSQPDVSDPGLTAARLGRLRERLAREPADAVVLTSPESVHYATGYRSVAGQIFAGHTMAALVTADQVWLVCPAADTAAAVDAGVAGDRIVPYGRFYFAGEGAAAGLSDRHASFQEALAVVLRPVSGQRLGVEGPAAPVAAELAGDRATDATGWVLGVRAVKLPGEQALLRTAAELAENGIRAALAGARAGVTERELAAVVATMMVAGGGTPRFVVVTAGPRSPLGDAFPTDRPCHPGDLLRFDVGCVYQGYWSDLARTAVVGEPTARQQAHYDALLAGLHAELELARPGVTAGEVFRAAQRTVEAAGIAPYRRHHTGHAIGLSVYERPVISPDSEVPLAPGMVFCLETPYYELGWGGLMVEDTGVVTEAGFDLFTHLDRSLRVVPT